MSSTQLSRSSTGTHRDLVGEHKIQEYEATMRKGYWMQNKKGPSVNLVDDGSFLVDRQLEDQRFLMKKNKNPQLSVPTNADKTRSQLILRKKVNEIKNTIII